MTQTPRPQLPADVPVVAESATPPDRPSASKLGTETGERDSTPAEQITLEQIPILIAEGRKRLAEFEANPTTWAMLMHSQWATAALPLLLDALDLQARALTDITEEPTE